VGTADPTVVDAFIGADGSRLATKAASSFGFLIPDLHGSVAAAVSSDFALTTDAFRYDAWGDVVAKQRSALPTPWRYQGRMLVSGDSNSSGPADLYDAGARYYSPGLGTFTQFDSVSGSAQNPVSMNRYLYAAANPATLVDPSGHCWGICIDINPVGFVQSAVSTVATVATAVAAPIVAPVVMAANVAVTLASDPHTLLAVASMLPVVGTAAAAIDVGLYLTEGDYGNAALASLALVPGGAMAKLGAKALSTFEKGDKALSAISKVTSKVSGALDTLGSKVAGKLDDAVKAVGGKIDDGLDALKSKLGRQAGDDLGGAAAKTVDDAAGGAGHGLKQVGDSGISCPGMSFSPDTTVATRAGPIPISNLHVGDQVLAYDPKTGETKAHTVDAVMVNLDPVVEHLDTSAGSIETTPNHPFFTADRSWVEAGSLLPGERLRTDSGTDAVVVGFTLEATPSAMWDLTVNTAHSFFVGSGAVLVHNCAMKDPMWAKPAADGASRYTPLTNLRSGLASAASATGLALGSMKGLPSWMKIGLLWGGVSVVGTVVFGGSQGYPGPGEPRPTPPPNPTRLPSHRPYVEPWKPGFWWR
jgi:RHS repeat-associated protein